MISGEIRLKPNNPKHLRSPYRWGTAYAVSSAEGQDPTEKMKWLFLVWHKTAPDGDAPLQEIWKIRSIPPLPLLPCPLWIGVVVPVRVLFLAQIDLFEIIHIWLYRVQKIFYNYTKYININI